MELKKQTCKPCEGSIPPIDGRRAAEHLSKLHPGWKLTDGNKNIERIFECVNFSESVSLVNTIASIAEEQGHHPDISIFSYNHVRVTLSTHAIKGLSINDFIVASKIDASR